MGEGLGTESQVPAAGGRRFASNLRWQFVANASQALLGGAYLLLLGRTLGPTEFGVWSVVSALVLVAGLLLELRMQDVVARDFCHIDSATTPFTDEPVRIIDLFVIESLSRLMPSLGLIALAPLLAHSSGLPGDGVLLITLAALGFLVQKAGWGASTGLLRVLGRTDLIAMCLSADWGLRLLVTGLCTLVYGMNVSTALVIALFVGGLCNGVQVVLAGREFQRRVARIAWRAWSIAGLRARFAGIRRLLAANFGISAADLMAKDLDIALLSSLLSLEKIALYKLSKSFAQVLWRCIDPFYLAIMPEVRRLWIGLHHRELWKLVRTTSLRLAAVAASLVFLAWLVLTLFAELVLGSGYEGLPRLTLLMSAWILICAPLVWAHPLAVAIDRPELGVIGGILGSAAGLATLWGLTPLLGLVGAALAWALTTSLQFSFVALMATRSARRLEAPGVES